MAGAGGRAGEEDVEGGTLAFFALDFDESPVRDDDVSADSQPQAGALLGICVIRLFGGEEWFEDSADVLGGDSLSGVFDTKGNTVSARVLAG